MSSPELWLRSTQDALQWYLDDKGGDKILVAPYHLNPGRILPFSSSTVAIRYAYTAEREGENGARWKRRVARYWQTLRVLHELHEHYSCHWELWRGICYQARISHLFTYFSSTSLNCFQIVAFNGSRAARRRVTNVSSVVMKIQQITSWGSELAHAI